MSRFRPGRFIGVTAGTLVILAVGVYGPATLLGPLPTVSATLSTPAAGSAPTPPVLPAAGASAVTTIGTSAIGVEPAAIDSTAVDPIGVSGSADALPMASAAKIVTALVVLDAKPLTAKEPGPKLTISAADYQDYIDYSASFARTVVVFPGESWTERELLESLILGSSNNHADTLARWAYGSAPKFLDAASAWLATNGLGSTTMACLLYTSDAAD